MEPAKKFTEEQKSLIARSKQNILITKIMLIVNLISSGYTGYVFWVQQRSLNTAELISFWGIMITSIIYTLVTVQETKNNLPR